MRPSLFSSKSSEMGLEIESLKALVNGPMPKAQFQRALCVLIKVEFPELQAKRLGELVGLSTASVHQIHSAFHKMGVRIFQGSAPGGRRRSLMTPEEEQAFLDQFLNGQHPNDLDVPELKRALEARLSRSIPYSTVYRILHRNGWSRARPERKTIWKHGVPG